MTKFSTLLKYFDNVQDIADFMLAEIQAEIEIEFRTLIWKLENVMPPKEYVESVKVYTMINNELVELNREDDVVIESTEQDDFIGRTFDDMEFTATIDNAEELWKTILPRGYVNAMILKRDGYLDETNGVME